MKWKFIILLAVLLLLPACSKNDSGYFEAAPTGTSSQADLSEKQAGEFLAYSHRVSAEFADEDIPTAYSETVDACLADRKNGCTILDARISSGTYASAYIKLRIGPKGVKPIIQTAVGKGSLVDEYTHVDDLAQPVVDTEKRLMMLKSHRDRLIQLQEKAANDIQALIKVSEELAKVQSQFEDAAGQEAHLKERIAKDFLEIHFISTAGDSFWQPIAGALSSFSSNLAEAISAVITTIAYLLPWLAVGIPALLLLRFLWRRGRSAGKPHTAQKRRW